MKFKNLFFYFLSLSVLALAACSGSNLAEEVISDLSMDVATISHLNDGMPGTLNTEGQKELVTTVDDSTVKYFIQELSFYFKDLEIFACEESESSEPVILNLEQSVDFVSQDDLQEFELLLGQTVALGEYCDWTLSFSGDENGNAFYIEGAYSVDDAALIGFNWSTQTNFEVSGAFKAKDSEGLTFDHPIGGHHGAEVSLLFGLNYQMLLEGLDPSLGVESIVSDLLDRLINGAFHHHADSDGDHH
ncbi:MAG: hypothetical protein KDK66_08810 [Deltaproteobacteria bacterium]|nr:hypothetical protein [Deltaproteobacteria bacterium]